MRKRLFKENESYKHLYAKSALVEMLNHGYMGLAPLRIDIEKNFCMNGFVLFRPDVIVYDKNGISVIFEIYHTHKISDEKFEKMYSYFFHHGYLPQIIEISADVILNQLANG